jgi:hypothetical protein
MGLITSLKDDMLELVNLSRELGKYDQMLLQHLNMNDKLNYNPDKCDLINKKTSKLYERYYFIMDKWFND